MLWDGRDLTRREVLRAGTGAALGLCLPSVLAERAAAAAAPGGRARLGSRRRRALEQLARQLHGRLLHPGEPGYAAATQPANTRFDRVRPLAAALCADEHDVAACVAWARQHRIDAVARTGGHSYAGYSTTTGLVIDLGNLKEVHIDASGRATIGGGAVNRDVFDATVGGNFLLPAGTCLGVGVGGLTLGGGIGYNSHWAGLTCDHLLGSRLVSAAGELLHLDASHHSDLLWACRGGAGGNFGINTSFTFELQRVPMRNVSFYRFDYRGAEDAVAVLSAFDRLLAGAPEALNAVAMSQAVEVGPGGPREAIATFSRGQYLGPLHELVELVKPLLEAATPVATTLQTLSFWEMQAMLDGAEAEPHAFGDISRYAAAPLPEKAIAKVVDLLSECPSRDANDNGSVWSLGWIGGAVNAIDRQASAYVHRNMHTLWRATPVWETNGPAAVERDLVAWSRAVIDAIAPYAANESYQNFPNRGIADWQQQYYAENLGRLIDVKARYDPHNVFHNHQSIPTA
ncbi:MAG TPA: FAD-binding oxidoreductase [Solirubrobacteraceae bacterium]|nr:FAD-binding oxidoreductase [Solirubrobacteraceae bacterium]